MCGGGGRTRAGWDGQSDLNRRERRGLVDYF